MHPRISFLGPLSPGESARVELALRTADLVAPTERFREFAVLASVLVGGWLSPTYHSANRAHEGVAGDGAWGCGPRAGNRDALKCYALNARAEIRRDSPRFAEITRDYPRLTEIARDCPRLPEIARDSDLLVRRERPAGE